jgi:hypothetical protein
MRKCSARSSSKLRDILTAPNTMSEVHGLYTQCCLSTSQHQWQDRGSEGHSTPSLSSQSLPQTPQDIKDPLGSSFKIYNDDSEDNNENAPT